MSTKVIELKATSFTQKCKTGMLKVVTKHSGVDELKVDGEKGTLTVVGCVDPVSVVTALRKAGYYVEVTSVGPPKKPDPKPDPPNPEQHPYYSCPAHYQYCQFHAVTYDGYDYEFDTPPFCSIL